MSSLANCVPTLLADPMGLDAVALDEAIGASRDAGFDAIGLWAFHVQFGGDEAVRAVLDAGLPVATLDAALSWVEGPSDAAHREIDGLLSLADRLGCAVVHATTLGPVDDLGAARDGYASIAARADAAGVRLALEFLPWTGVPTLAVANQIAAHGGPAAGILLDTWHWVRQPGGPDLALLRSLPGERITSVQLSDAAPEPATALEPEAMGARLLPGDGIVDHGSLWEALDAIGASPVIAAEVMSSSLVARGPAAMADAVHRAARSVLPPDPAR